MAASNRWNLGRPFPSFRDREHRFYVRFGSEKHTWEVCDRTRADKTPERFFSQDDAERAANRRNGVKCAGCGSAGPLAHDDQRRLTCVGCAIVR